MRKERLTYLALAPLTNLAAFLGNHPEQTHRIERIIFIGGQTHPGKIRVGSFHFHDANVLKDPMAVRKVLQSQVPIILVPPEIAGLLRLSARDFTGLGSRAEFLRRETGAWRWFWNSFADKNGGPVFDAAAVLAAADRSLVRLQNGTASLNREGELIINSTRKTPADRSITFVAALAPVAAKRSLLRRLSRATQPMNLMQTESETSLRVSLIIPCWKDHAAALAFAEKWSANPLVYEVIVAGVQDELPSDDATARFKRCATNAPSRGVQMNLGAQLASGDVLLFHHVDSVLTDAHLLSLQHAMREPKFVGGGFYRKFDERHPGLRRLENFERAHCRAFGTIYGDQSLFVTARSFCAAGRVRRRSAHGRCRILPSSAPLWQGRAA